MFSEKYYWSRRLWYDPFILFFFTEMNRISWFQLLSSFTENTFSMYMVKHKSRVDFLCNTFNFKMSWRQNSQAPKSMILLPVLLCMASP